MEQLDILKNIYKLQYLVLFILLVLFIILKKVILIQFAVVTFLFLILVFIIGTYKLKKINRLTKKIDINLNSSLFVITTDGINYVLNQKTKIKESKKIINVFYLARCILKKYDKESRPTKFERNLFDNEMLELSQWLKKNGITEIKTFTHGKIIKRLKKHFDVEPNSPIKTMSCYRWVQISSESRGKLIEKPNDFRHYKLKPK